ncbi:MAG: Tol-Pal system subunit TolQ [Bdellovibrionales bacterium]|jgi:biopolymer transport protein TolQ|nr:Tol-Pal system subunit TolQ [Bdellovibrionales bacterium]MBT3526758.1 Tol-Pal system subunit TolQ [Bdellovibrionales bacterium]MBT7767739.1 Tol-Pal system subunit TolQ [Bdellovibrionales bacterium]
MSNHLDIVQIILDSGLVVKGVLIILFGSSLLSWAIMFKKRSILKQMKASNNHFLEIFNSTENFQEVTSRCETLDFSPLHIIFTHGRQELLNLQEETGSNDRRQLLGHFKNFGLNGINRALERGALQANKRLDELMVTLASIGSLAPFVGLFGTVWGIIDSFRALGGESASLAVVAPGIAEALVATAIGLAAAIPAVWFYNYFSGENGRQLGEMEYFSKEFLNRVEKNLIQSK